MAKPKASGTSKTSQGRRQQTNRSQVQEKKRGAKQKQEVKTSSRHDDDEKSSIHNHNEDVEHIQYGGRRRSGRNAKLKAVKKMATMKEKTKSMNFSDEEDDDEDDVSVDLENDNDDDEEEEYDDGDDDEDFETKPLVHKKGGKANTRGQTQRKFRKDSSQHPGQVIVNAPLENEERKFEERYVCQASQEQFLSLSESDSSSDEEEVKESSKVKISQSDAIPPNSKTDVIPAGDPKMQETISELTDSIAKVENEEANMAPKSMFDDFEDTPDFQGSQPDEEKRCTTSLFDDFNQECETKNLATHGEEVDVKPLVTSPYFSRQDSESLKSPSLGKGRSQKCAKYSRDAVKSSLFSESGDEEADESDFEEIPMKKEKQTKQKSTHGKKIVSGIGREMGEKTANKIVKKDESQRKAPKGKKESVRMKEEEKLKDRKEDDTHPASKNFGKARGQLNEAQSKQEITDRKNDPVHMDEEKRHVKDLPSRENTLMPPAINKRKNQTKQDQVKNRPSGKVKLTEIKEDKRKRVVKTTHAASENVGQIKSQKNLEEDRTSVRCKETATVKDEIKKVKRVATSNADEVKCQANKIQTKNKATYEKAKTSKVESGKRKVAKKNGDEMQAPSKDARRVKIQTEQGETKNIVIKNRDGGKNSEKDVPKATAKKRGRVKSQSAAPDTSSTMTAGKRGGKTSTEGVRKNSMESPAKKRKLSISVKKISAEDLKKAGKGKVKEKKKMNIEVEKMEVDVKEEDDDAEMSSDDSQSEWEEVEDTPLNELGEPMLTPKKEDKAEQEMSLEIDIDLPGTSGRAAKKKKREYNWANYFQWQVNKYNKERQLQLHKAHLVLLLASSFHSNKICNKIELQCIALSVIPQEILSKRPKLLNTNYLAKVLAWFKGCFQIQRDVKEAMRTSLHWVLPSRFEKKHAASERELVHMFAIIMRCLGADVRLVFSLQPITFKAKILTKKFKREHSHAGMEGQLSQKSTPEQKMLSPKESNTQSTSSDAKTMVTPKSSKSSTSKSAQNVPKNQPSSSYPKKTPSKSSHPTVTSSPTKISASTPKTQSLSPYPKATPSTAGEPSSKSSSSMGSSSASKAHSVSKTKTPISRSSQPLGKSSSSVTKSLSSAQNSPSLTASSRGVVKRASGQSHKEQKSASRNTPVNKGNGGLDNIGSKKGAGEGGGRATGGEQTPRTLRTLRTKNNTRRKTASKMAINDDDNDDDDDDDYQEESDEDDYSDYEEELRRSATKRKSKMPSSKMSAKKKPKTSSSTSNLEEVSSDSDFEVKMMSVTKQPRKMEEKKTDPKKKASRKVLSSDSSEEIMVVDIKKPGSDCWLEVYLTSEKRWMCVDCVRAVINKPEMCEQKATKPITYVIAVENDGCVKDVTQRYASKWMTETHKLRKVDDWWEETLKPYHSDKTRDRKEDYDAKFDLTSKPLPTSIGEYKNHPLYALKRHLLKFEAIYPESAAAIGYCRGEAVYSRDCVHVLHTRETWMKEAKSIRIGEKPYKMVKPRPKWKKGEGIIKTEEATLGIYGAWQVEDYIPPPAVDGKVPRNEYGNVELFKPSMLPAGTVHLKIPGLNKVARKLDIDCAPAMMGWDFHSGFNHPVMDGFVVCEEHAETLVAAWEEDRVEREKKEKEKREARAMEHWKLFIKSLLIRERLKERYGKNHPNSGSATASQQSEQDGRKDTSPVKASWPENKMTAFTGDEGNLLPFEKKVKKKKKR